MLWKREGGREQRKAVNGRIPSFIVGVVESTSEIVCLKLQDSGINTKKA